MNNEEKIEDFDISLIDDENLTQDEKYKVIQYLKTLKPIEIKAFKIAKNHLKTSFNILKSNGYIDWCSENQNK